MCASMHPNKYFRLGFKAYCTPGVVFWSFLERSIFLTVQSCECLLSTRRLRHVIQDRFEKSVESPWSVVELQLIFKHMHKV